MNTKICKLKVVILVKDKAEKENRIANLSAVFGPKGIKALDVLKKFDCEVELLKYMSGTPLIVKVYVYVSVKSGKTDDYRIYINTPSISYLVKKQLAVDKFSQKPGKEITTTVDNTFIEKICDLKYTDNNEALKLGRMKSIVGTLNSMGIKVKESI